MLIGDFAGGVIAGEVNGVRLRGQIGWQAKVSGESNGIKLEGWLQ